MHEKFLDTVLTDTKPLFETNKKAIHNYNKNMIPKSFLVAIITLIIPFIISIFKQDMVSTFPAYIIALSLMLILFVLYQVKRYQRYTLLFAYLFCTILYVLVMYLSIFKFYDRPAASIIIFFVVVPLIFVDKSMRMNT